MEIIMEVTWNSYGYHMEMLWKCCVHPMEIVWNPYGNPCENSLDILWKWYRNHIAILWRPLERLWKSFGNWKSYWNSCRNTIEIGQKYQNTMSIEILMDILWETMELLIEIVWKSSANNAKFSGNCMKILMGIACSSLQTLHGNPCGNSYGNRMDILAK